MDSTPYEPYILDPKLNFITCRAILQTLTQSKKKKVRFSYIEDIAFVSRRGLLRALFDRPTKVWVYWYEPCLCHLSNYKPNYYNYRFPNRALAISRYIQQYINRDNLDRIATEAGSICDVAREFENLLNRIIHHHQIIDIEPDEEQDDQVPELVPDIE